MSAKVEMLAEELRDAVAEAEVVFAEEAVKWLHTAGTVSEVAAATQLAEERGWFVRLPRERGRSVWAAPAREETR